MKKIGCVGWMILLFASCSDYLNVVPDNTLTLEDIFTVKEDA
ncbi:RagB/SusD family nutrient uptake outer membrane protein, partial [termite gut metagenome]